MDDLDLQGARQALAIFPCVALMFPYETLGRRVANLANKDTSLVSRFSAFCE